LELSMDLNFTDEFHEVIELNWRKWKYLFTHPDSLHLAIKEFREG
jgi:hypothetical protein